MFPQNKRGINGIVLVFFVLILVVAALIVMFSFSGQQQPNAVSAPSEQSSQVSAPSGDTGLNSPGASNVPVQEAKQCTVSCDDKDPCTKDSCNAVYGECDHEAIPGCCGNKVCDGSETCYSSAAGVDNSKACAIDCGSCPVSVEANVVPAGWCSPNGLDHSLLPPYASVKSSLSGGKATLVIEVLNPSEFTAKDVQLEIYPSAGFDLDAGQSKAASMGDIAKYDVKSASFSFAKQTNALIGSSNPTSIKLTYSLNGKNAVVCTQGVFS